MSDFDKYSSLQPPSDVQERVTWLREQEERIANLVRRKLVALIVDATESFNRSLTASGDMSVFDSIPTQWSSWVDDVLLEELQGMYLAGGLLAYETSSASGILSDSVTNLWVEVVNQNAADYALTAQNRMKDVGMTAWNDIKNKVSKSIETGTSVEDLKTLLEKNRSFSEFRADTIARTETLNAYNNGNWEGNQALGEYGPTHKYWMATLDGRARETHVAVDNEVVPINEPFVVGGESMMYPHSPGASAKNVVNCRCTYGVLWPGDPHPVTGEPIGGTITEQATLAIEQEQTEQFVEIAEESPYRPAKYGMKDFDGSWRQIMDDAGGVYADLDNPNGDGFLVELWKRQGFTAKPRVVTTTQLDDLVESGWTRMHRGIGADDMTTVDQYVGQFIDGDIPFAGKGMFGNGTYAAASRETAEAFAKQNTRGQAVNAGKVIDMALSPDAKIIDFEDIIPHLEDLVKEERIFRAEMMAKYDDGSDNWFRVQEMLSPVEKEIYENISMKEYLLAEKPGSWATANGYDAIRIERPRVRFTGTDDDFVDDVYYVILNRGAVAIGDIA